MENQDKLFDQLKSAAKKAESKDFPAMEKVWSRVEEKLDNKEDKKTTKLWKKLAIAASLLLFFSLGYQFFKSDRVPNVTPKNSVVSSETKDTVQKSPTNPIVIVEEDSPKTENPIVRKDADKILGKQITNESVAATEFENDDVEESNYKRDSSTEQVSGMIASEKKISVATTVKSNPVGNLKTITGIVSDETGPLPGANVFIRGSTIATQTDYDGKFTIQAKKGDVLQFGFVGMGEGFATVGNKSTVNMKLNNGTALNEVVVTSLGYFTKESKKVSSSVATVKTGERRRSSGKDSKRYRDGDKKSSPQSPGELEQSLHGKVAGVHISNNSKQDDEANDYNYYRGNPSTRNKIGNVIFNDVQNIAFDTLPNGKILIRGLSSKEQATSLYIIDGIPVKAELVTKINPGEIESINILKQENATSIYGSSGSNGAIIIKTKEGWNKRKIRRMERQLESAKKAESQSVIDAKNTPQIEVTQEDYDPFIENPFESPKTAPLSTFSIDVDNASYTNVRRFINNGQTVPKDAVRVEEMVNFFKYDYPQPKDSSPFSINSEYSDCPWNAKHKLLRIGLQGKNTDIEKLPASNLVFLIDVSRSMSGTNKLPLLIQSMKILVNELRSKDKVSIVVYAGAAGLVLPPTSGNDKAAIIAALENLNAGGSTAGGAGIELAYKIAGENFIKGGNNRVVLATDGDFNVGSSSNTDMQTLIEEKRKSGVFLTCLGFGMGNYKDSKMEILSDKGNGNYAYIDNIQEANRFLGKEFKGSMFTIAKDVKIQIEFNPYYVQGYRLIGYENRKLNAEDFKNDAIDAGELGSGHTVTALYEVIPNGIKSDFSKEIDELKFSKSEPMSANFNNHLAFIKFRYKKPNGDKSIVMDQYIKNESAPLRKSSADFKFSAAVAWFGLKLRDSKLIENKSSEDIKYLAKQGVSNDNDGYKAEFIRLVEAIK